MLLARPGQAQKPEVILLSVWWLIMLILVIYMAGLTAVKHMCVHMYIYIYIYLYIYIYIHRRYESVDTFCAHVENDFGVN